MDVTYLDHNSTTPVPKEILADLAALTSRTFGNPSSLHSVGRQSRHLIREATQTIAKLLVCSPEDVHFTSGASEGNSWAIFSATQIALKKGRKPRILISSIEHDSTLLAAKNSGAEVCLLRTLASGQVDLEDLESKLRSSGTWDLLSLLHANNETGVIQPVGEAMALARAHGVPFHLDCAQTLARVPISVQELGADYLAFSGHKIGAPRGVGLVISQTSKLVPLVHGLQQQSLRGGTENVLGVVALGRAIELAKSGNAPFPERLAKWHRELETRLRKTVDGVVIHGERSPRLRNTSFIGFEGLESDSILIGLDLEGICASSGSACSSGRSIPSHVLLAMGCEEAMARSSVRFSSGRETSWQDFERVLDVLPRLVSRSRR